MITVILPLLQMLSYPFLILSSAALSIESAAKQDSEFLPSDTSKARSDDDGMI